MHIIQIVKYFSALVWFVVKAWFVQSQAYMKTETADNDIFLKHQGKYFSTSETLQVHF